MTGKHVKLLNSTDCLGGNFQSIPPGPHPELPFSPKKSMYFCCLKIAPLPQPHTSHSRLIRALLGQAKECPSSPASCFAQWPNGYFRRLHKQGLKVAALHHFCAPPHSPPTPICPMCRLWICRFHSATMANSHWSTPLP